MSSAKSSSRRRRWAAVVAAATAAMVLAASGVVFLRLRHYLVRDMDGDLADTVRRASESLGAATDEPAARMILGLLAGGAGTPVSLRVEGPFSFTVGHLASHAELAAGIPGSPEPATVGDVGDLGYPFRVLTVETSWRGRPARVTALNYLKAHERRLRHHALNILWATLGSGLAAWGIAWWISGRLFGPLEEAYRREAAFSADVAHQLRTPLTALTGEIEVALGAPRAAGEYQAVLASALEEVRRLTGLVNHLLFLARADAGQERLTLGAVDLGTLCREMGEAFGPLAEDKGLRLLVEAPERLEIRGDAVRLRQALANLLDNAIRHTAAGEVRIKAEAADGGARLTVSDTGSGIAAEDFPRIFERFYRGKDSQGSGLGLAIVKWVAEAHGGRVAVESAPRGGSVFRIELPGKGVYT